MNKLVELKANFCWKSKTKSLWQENPDLLDRVIARIHSEATVYDAIIRSKNRHMPTNENIYKTVKFLEENSFWRSNPFSLISCTENDPDIIETTDRLQKKCVRDLWDPGDELARKKPNPPNSLTNAEASHTKSPTYSTATSIYNNDQKLNLPTVSHIASAASISTNSIIINSVSQLMTTNECCPLQTSLSKPECNEYCIKSDNHVNSPIINLIKTETSSPSTGLLEIPTSPRKFAVVSAKSIGIKNIRRNNNIINDYSYDSCTNVSRTYAEAVRGSAQANLDLPSNKALKTTSVWD